MQASGWGPKLTSFFFSTKEQRYLLLFIGFSCPRFNSCPPPSNPGQRSHHQPATNGLLLWGDGILWMRCGWYRWLKWLILTKSQDWKSSHESKGFLDADEDADGDDDDDDDDAEETIKRTIVNHLSGTDVFSAGTVPGPFDGSWAAWVPNRKHINWFWIIPLITHSIIVPSSYHHLRGKSLRSLTFLLKFTAKSRK